MESFSFSAAYGDETKTVEITRVSGRGDEGYFHILIDRCYKGTITWRRGQWVVLEQIPTFTTEDLDILVELLEQHLKEFDQKK